MLACLGGFEIVKARESKLQAVVRLTKEGRSAAYIADFLEINLGAVYVARWRAGIRKHKPRYWKPEEWKLAQEMRARHASMKEIGVALGRSEDQISAKFQWGQKKEKLRGRAKTNQAA